MPPPRCEPYFMVQLSKWVAGVPASEQTSDRPPPASADGALPPLLSPRFRAPPPIILPPSTGFCVHVSPLASATSAASAAGAYTILWLRHWSSASTALRAWPRYYGSSTTLDFAAASLEVGAVPVPIAWQREGMEGPHPRVLDAFRADAAHTAGSRALALCTRQAYPALQLGLCPGNGSGSAPALTHFDGVGLVLERAALLSLAMSDADALPSFNVLAHRSAFPLLTAFSSGSATESNSGADDNDQGGLRVLAAAFGEDGPWGVRGWHAALTAPGSLCGGSTPRTEPKPEHVMWPSHPDATEFTRFETWSTGAPAGTKLLIATEAAASASATAKDDLDAPYTKVAKSSSFLDNTHTVPLSAPPASWGSSVPLVRDFGGLLFAPHDAPPRPFTGGACRPALPLRRDIMLAVEFNTNWVASNYATLHALYDRYFPTILMFADTSAPVLGLTDAPNPHHNDTLKLPRPPVGFHDTARGVYSCRTGMPKPGYSAHVCMERVAPLAVGRVGVFWTSDDALVHVWRLDALDTHRIWAQRELEFRWRLDAGGAKAGPIVLSYDNPSAWDRNVEAWAETHHPPEVRAMEARNFAGAAPQQLRDEAAHAGLTAPLLRVGSGHSDSFFVPRAVLPLWGTMLSENASVGLMQEHAIPSIIAATSFLRHVYRFTYAGVERGVAAAALRIDVNADGSHPWKLGDPDVRAKLLAHFRAVGYAAPASEE